MSTVSFKQLYKPRTEGRHVPECRRLLPLNRVLRARDGATSPGTIVHPWILQQALQDSRLMKDARELGGADAEVRLLGRGFSRQPDADGRRVYAFGKAHLYGTGQRVVLERGGGGMLITFAGPQVQVIEVAEGGSPLRNDVQSLP